MQRYITLYWRKARCMVHEPCIPGFTWSNNSYLLRNKVRSINLEKLCTKLLGNGMANIMLGGDQRVNWRPPVRPTKIAALGHILILVSAKPIIQTMVDFSIRVFARSIGLLLAQVVSRIELDPKQLEGLFLLGVFVGVDTPIAAR